MKKFLLAILTSFILSSAVNAQDPFFHDMPYKERNSGSFGKHESIVSLGYGVVSQIGTPSGASFTSLIGYMAGLKDRNMWKRTGPIYVKYEYGIANEIGIGGSISYAGFKERNSYTEDPARISFIDGSLMVFYHGNKFINAKNTDVYVGAGMGLTNVTLNTKPNSVSQQGFHFVARAGVRQYLGGPLAVFGDVGTDGISVINLGFSFRFSGKQEHARNERNKKVDDSEAEEKDDTEEKDDAEKE